MRKDEVAGGLVLFAFGAVTAGFSLGMPLGSLRAAGSGMFPLALGILLVFLSGLWILRCLTQGKATFATTSPGAAVRQVLPFVGTMALATLLLQPLGYLLTSLLLLFALFRILGSRSWAWCVSLSVLVAGMSYVVFVLWLKVPLPSGLVGL